MHTCVLHKLKPSTKVTKVTIPTQDFAISYSYHIPIILEIILPLYYCHYIGNHIPIIFPKSHEILPFIIPWKSTGDSAIARQVGRSDLQRGAFAQGRQAFRRSRAALPEKLLLKRSEATTGGTLWLCQHSY